MGRTRGTIRERTNGETTQENVVEGEETCEKEAEGKLTDRARMLVTGVPLGHGGRLSS
jgi:hypothetical protein